GSPPGAILAATFLTLVSIGLQAYPEVRMSLYSLVLILVMLFRPQGLWGTRSITGFFPGFRSEDDGATEETAAEAAAEAGVGLGTGIGTGSTPGQGGAR
ncbi:MAG TPA: hypothetical protein VIL08_02090, partial [Limnochorda sp.]